MRRLALATVMVMLISGTFYVPARAQSTAYFSLVKSYWGGDEPMEVSPGDVAPLSVVLRYEFGYSTNSVVADLLLPQGFIAVGGGSRPETHYNGNISTGSIITLQFSIFITPGAARSGYTAYLELSYYVSALSRWQNDVLGVSFDVTGKPSIDLQILNRSASQGNQLIMVALSNNGEADANDLKVTSINSTSARAEFKGSTTLGTLQPGQNITIPVNVYIPSGLGNNLLSIAVNCSCVGPLSVFYSFSKTLQLPLAPTTMISPVVLSLDSTQVIQGERSQITINVKNNANHNISRIRLSFAPDSNIKIMSVNEFFIHQLQPQESTQVHTDLYIPSTATSTAATLSVNLTYLDEDLEIVQNSEQKLSLILAVSPSTLVSPLELDVEPSVLPIGKASEVFLKVTNKNSYAIPEATLSLRPDAFLKVAGKNTFSLGTLEPNQTIRVSTEALVPLTTSPITTLVLDLAYVDPAKGSLQSEQETINLLLVGVIQIYLADIMLIPSSPVSGTPFSITVTLINTGTSTAYASYVVPMIEGRPLTQLGPHATYLGNIEANAQTYFTINLQLWNTTWTSMDLPIELHYIDNLRSEYNTSFTVPITIQAAPGTTTVTSQTTTLQFPTLPISAIIVLALLAVGAVLVVALVVRRSRRRK